MATLTIILGLLILPLLFGAIVNRLAKRIVASPSLLGCIGITLVFCFTGSGHFIITEPMAEMLPPWVPARIPLVYVTGVIEIAAAFMVLVPRLRAMVGGALIVMLVLFLPVNIYAAVNRIEMGGHEWGPLYLLVRIPVQAILVGWIWWFAVRPEATKPFRFACEATLRLSPQEISARVLDLERWPDFAGYGLLPGIKVAEFEVRTPEVVGTKIRVLNTDGSRHVEEIVEWEPDSRLRLSMREFSPTLSRLASGFDETWEFKKDGEQTQVVRSFEMHPGSPLTRPLLWMIACLLRRAIARHLQQMRDSS